MRKIKKTFETQEEMNTDSFETLTKTLKSLKRILKKLKGLVSEEMWQLYDNAQALWEIYISAEYKILEKEYEGGSILPLMINVRHNDLAKVRIKYFKEVIKRIGSV